MIKCSIQQQANYKWIKNIFKSNSFFQFKVGTVSQSAPVFAVGKGRQMPSIPYDW